MDKTIFPKLKHKNDNYGNIAHVDNLQKKLDCYFLCVCDWPFNQQRHKVTRIHNAILFIDISTMLDITIVIR